MAVNTLNFLFFFIAVFAFYYSIQRSAKWQNVILFTASYIFYGIADIKMIPLLFLATAIFYGLGIVIERSNDTNPRGASLLTTLGVVIGIGILFYFKYLGFFVEQFSVLLGAMGIGSGKVVLSILMPLGISFFTFKLISYPIEIHRRHIAACRNFISFGTYIAFFPTILSGPIDRPKFLEQLQESRRFDYSMAVDGTRQILWGIFKKMVIADNLNCITANIWSIYESCSGMMMLFVACLYTFQMYADFSGYSDMAIGVGKLLGLKITVNFKYPLFAQNIAEYWRKWHISLTSWLTDYVYMPLNIRFRNYGKWGMIAAVMINIELVGLWHGANWTFVLFGLYHGLLFIPLIVSGAFMKKQKEKTGRWGLPSPSMAGRILFTYVLVSIGLVIFSASNLTECCHYFTAMIRHLTWIPTVEELKHVIYGVVSGLGGGLFGAFISILFPPLVYIEEWRYRKHEYALAGMVQGKNKVCRMAIYILMAVVITFMQGISSQFIYFQF